VRTGELRREIGPGEIFDRLTLGDKGKGSAEMVGAGVFGVLNLDGIEGANLNER
jgi:hypothetical protein